MDGSIEVESQVGVGSRFKIRLPLIAITKAAPPRQAGLPTRFDGTRVLLVEDNLVNQFVSTHLLRKFGCEVTQAIDGQDAINLLEESEFDVVFMDVRMPVLDGLEATRQIRRMEESKHSHTPIVALSAGALAEERERCIQAGMDEYVSKPFTDDSLRTVLARWGCVQE
jgi:CheY-like chemotaxis protein